MTQTSTTEMLQHYDLAQSPPAAKAQAGQEEDWFRLISDITADAWFCADRDGQLTFVNRAACEQLGYTRTELLQLRFHDVGAAQDEKRFRELYAFAKTGPLPLLESTLRRKNGSPIPVEITLRHVPSRGGPRLFAMARDTTPQKRAEQKLLETQETSRRHAEELEARVAERTAKLEETVRSLESFCYSIAHDLRAPLRAMRGFSTVLLDDYAHLFDDVGKDCAARIAAAAARMDTLIQDLLLYGRISHLEITPQEVSLHTAIQNAIAQLSNDIELRGAMVEVEAPLPAVMGHPTLVEQILLNLLANALKFVAPGATPRIKISASELGAAIRVCVRDNGIGIEPIYQEKIFRVFERLHAHDEYPGTGIGLAIVQKALERMGGRVGVESTAGAGSCFWIELPKAG